jgi:transposase
MSMGRVSDSVVPVETARVAWAASPKGTPAMLMRDRLQDLFVDGDFADWFPTDGRRGVSPARLALVSVLQYAENLTDRQAARAVACRIDWKYALGMELTEPGFDHSVLSEFRDRLAEGDRADRLLALMVDRLAEAGLVRARGRQRTDSTHVLAAVRRLSRVELVVETLRTALEALARLDEVWLAGVMQPQWVGRYGRSARHERQPTGAIAVRQYVEQVGADGIALLHAVYSQSAPAGGPRIGAVEVLRQVWVQQYWFDESGQPRWREAKMSRARKSREGTVRRRSSATADDDDTEPARVPWSSLEVVSPHDPHARFSHKPGKVEWVGYKDHQTETCDEQRPNVIARYDNPGPGTGRRRRRRDPHRAGQAAHRACGTPSRQRLCDTRNGSPGVDCAWDNHCRAGPRGSSRRRAARLRQGRLRYRLASPDRYLSTRDSKSAVETHDGRWQA